MAKQSTLRMDQASQASHIYYHIFKIPLSLDYILVIKNFLPFLYEKQVKTCSYSKHISDKSKLLLLSCEHFTMKFRIKSSFLFTFFHIYKHWMKWRCLSCQTTSLKHKMRTRGAKVQRPWIILPFISAHNQVKLSFYCLITTQLFEIHSPFGLLLYKPTS